MSHSRHQLAHQLLYFYAMTNSVVKEPTLEKTQHIDKFGKKFPHHEKRVQPKHRQVVHQPAAKGFGRK